MAQQTAVEWFAFQIMNSWNDIKNGKTSIDELIEQAKQMEKLMEKDYICNKCKHGKDMQQM